MDEKLLKDFLETAIQDKYNWEVIMPKFPELKDVDLQVLKDYAETAKVNNYNYDVINPKFPELFKADTEVKKKVSQPEQIPEFLEAFGTSVVDEPASTSQEEVTESVTPTEQEEVGSLESSAPNGDVNYDTAVSNLENLSILEKMDMGFLKGQIGLSDEEILSDPANVKKLYDLRPNQTAQPNAFLPSKIKKYTKEEVDEQNIVIDDTQILNNQNNRNLLESVGYGDINGMYKPPVKFYDDRDGLSEEETYYIKDKETGEYSYKRAQDIDNDVLSAIVSFENSQFDRQLPRSRSTFIKNNPPEKTLGDGKSIINLVSDYFFPEDEEKEVELTQEDISNPDNTSPIILDELGIDKTDFLKWRKQSLRDESGGVYKFIKNITLSQEEEDYVREKRDFDTVQSYQANSLNELTNDLIKNRASQNLSISKEELIQLKKEENLLQENFYNRLNSIGEAKKLYPSLLDAEATDLLKRKRLYDAVKEGGSVEFGAGLLDLNRVAGTGVSSFILDFAAGIPGFFDQRLASEGFDDKGALAGLSELLSDRAEIFEKEEGETRRSPILDGKPVLYRGQEYIVESNGNVYDKESNIWVDGIISDKDYKEIQKRASNVTNDVINWTGGSFSSAGVNQAVQLVGLIRSGGAIKKSLGLKGAMAGNVGMGISSFTSGVVNNVDDIRSQLMAKGMSEKEAITISVNAGQAISTLDGIFSGIAGSNEKLLTGLQGIKEQIKNLALSKGAKDFTKRQFINKSKELLKESGKELGEELSVLLSEKVINNLVNKEIGQDVLNTEVTRAEFIETVVMTLAVTGTLGTPGIISGYDRTELLRTAAKDVKDLDKTLKVLVKEGSLTKQQAAETYAEVYNMQAAELKTKGTIIMSDNVEEAADLLSQRQNLKAQREGLEGPLKEDIDKRIQDTDEQIKALQVRDKAEYEKVKAETKPAVETEVEAEVTKEEKELIDDIKFSEEVLDNQELTQEDRTARESNLKELKEELSAVQEEAPAVETEVDENQGDGESRFRLDGLETEDQGLSEIVDEMNKMDEDEKNFTVPKEDKSSTKVDPIKESKSTTKLSEQDLVDIGVENESDLVKPISYFDGMPMVTGISDILAAGTIKDAIGKAMEVAGGIMFNVLGKNKKAAWAGVERQKSQDQYDAAVKLYNDNKATFDKLWADGKLPQGHVPMAIIRMSDSAVNSNEAVLRYLAPEVKSKPIKNQQAALNSLIEKLKNTAGKSNKLILNFISKNNITDLGSLLDAVSVDAKKRAKGDTKNTLALDARAGIFTNLTFGVDTKKITRFKDGDNKGLIKNPILRALYNNQNDKNSDVFLANNIYNAIGEPSMMKAKKGDVVSIVGIDVINGGVTDIDHENYGTGPKGRVIAIIENPTNGIDLFPTWRAKASRIFKKDSGGKRPNQTVVRTQTMGTAANDGAFQGDAPKLEMSDIDILIGKLKFAFPSVNVAASQVEFEAILDQPDVRTQKSKGKVILGLTKDGKIFINPAFDSLATPIHEFGHIWVDFLRSNASGKKGTALLARGLKLVEGTKALENAIKKYGDTKLAREEALVELMATKGESIINSAKESRFKEWMNATFKYIKEKFTTSANLFGKQEIEAINKKYKDLKRKQLKNETYDSVANNKKKKAEIDEVKKRVEKRVKNLTLEEFINTGLADLFSGKPLDADVKDNKNKFDAKAEAQSSKARFEISDDTINFIKDSRGQGKSDTDIETSLIKRGVPMPDIKAAFKKVGTKVNQKSKVSEEFAKGFDRVMKEIDGVVEKVKKRNTKESTSPKKLYDASVSYLKGTKLYENATDVQREKMIRDLRERFGQKENKSPSAKRLLFGKIDPNKITLTQKQAISAQIKSLNRGAKNVIQAFNEASKQLSEQISDMVSKGKITTNQAASIIKRFSKVNMLSDASIDSFAEYMRRVFKNANYAEDISIANKQRKQALKNVSRKIGIADAVSTQLNRIFSMNPLLIPESVFQEYLGLVKEFGERKSVLDISEITEVEKITDKILEKVDIELSQIPSLKDRMNEFGPEFLDGKIDFAATIKNMLDEEAITEEEAELMKKYKSDIVPKVEKVKKTEAEIEAEKKNIIDVIKKLSALQVSQLPSRFEKEVAGTFEKLINNKEVLDSLSLDDLKQIEKLYNNINNGYLPHLVQVMNEKMTAQLKSNELSGAIESGKVLPLSGIYAKFKNLITRKGAVLEAIRRNPLFYIDQIFGNFKGKPIFNSLFKDSAKGNELFTSKFKRVTGKIDASETAVAKSFGLNGNKTLMSKFKQMVYMIQLEHDSNQNNKETKHQAAAYIKKTIDSIYNGKTNYSDADAKMLEKLLDNFTDKKTGEINLKKLYDSFNKAEKNSIKEIQKVNYELGPMAVQTASIIRGTGIKARNNYVHLNVLNEEGSDPNSNESFVKQHLNSMNPSTKAKSLIERKGVVSAIDFDVYASAAKGAKGVLLDFYMTVPIRTARRTLNATEQKLKGSNKRIDSKTREKFNAVRQAYEEVLEDTFTNAYQQNTLFENVANYIKRNGYRAILASGKRFIAELSSNVSFALISNPKEFIKGSKVGVRFLNSDAAPKSMENLKSNQTNRIYPNEDMSGRMVDTNLLDKSEGIRGGKARRRFQNKLLQVWNITGKKYQGGVATLADALISTPDKLVMRPMWFGSFSTEFKKLTGVEPDLDKISENDSDYMSEFKNELEKATELADETSVMTGSTANPFLGILKGNKKQGDSGFKTAFNTFNNFMTTFLIYEYVTARTGIMNAIGKGHLSKRKGAALIGASTTRMIMYTMMLNVMTSSIASIMSSIRGEDEEEDETKSLDKKLGQSVLSSLLSLVVGRDFGNASKAVLNMGIEEVNKEILDGLREGDYDPYKDALAYQIIPTSDDRGTDLGKVLMKFTGPYSPIAKTADLGIKILTQGEKKTDKAKKRREKESYLRLPLEVLGSTGFVPMYKDVRTLVLDDLYNSVSEADKIKEYQDKQKEAAKDEKNNFDYDRERGKSDEYLKENFPDLYRIYIEEKKK